MHGFQQAVRLCLCWSGAAGAVGWHWPAGDCQPAASRCTSWPVGGAGSSGARAGTVKWDNPSGTPFDRVLPALDGAETCADAASVADAADGERGLLDSSATVMAPAGALKWRCRLPFVASSRVRGHLEDTRSRLSPGRGGVGAAGAVNAATARGGMGGKAEPAKARCRSRSWHQPPTGGWMPSSYQPPIGDWTSWRYEVGAWMRRRRCCTPWR